MSFPPLLLCWSEQAAFCEAGYLRAGNNEVIENAHVHERQSLLECLRQSLVCV